MQDHRVVSREEWLSARKALLVKEKEATRLRDKLNAERMALPRVKVEKSYIFDSPGGRKSLAELFGGRSQLIVYHFMLGPDWEAGCSGCSFLADHLDGALPHLEHHDVSLVAVSRAPLAKIAAYKARMGWRFPLGLVVRQRLQLRFSCLVHARTARERVPSPTTLPRSTPPTLMMSCRVSAPSSATNPACLSYLFVVRARR